MSDDEQIDQLAVPSDTGASCPNPTSSVIDPDICHTVMESLPDGILLFDRDCRIVVANIATEGLFGYSRDEMMSQSIEMLVPVSRRKRYVEEIATFFADPAQREMEGKVFAARRKNGDEIAVSISLGPIYSGDQLLACAVIRDVSQSERARKALRDAETQVRSLLKETGEANHKLHIEVEKRCETEGQLRQVIDSMFAFVGVFTLDGKVIEINRVALDTVSIERDQIVGKPFWETIWWSYSAEIQEQLKQSLAMAANGETVRYDVAMRVANGKSITIDATFGPLLDADGNIVQLIGSAVDITDRKHVAEELRQKELELTHVARLSMLGEMAAGLAHELNQPLTAVSALAEGALLRLERGNLSQSEFVHVCKRIAADAQRAGEIIRRLRKFVQKRKVERQKICVNELLREVVTFIEPELKQENITVHCRLQNGLWDVEVDPVEIQQVVVNLIRNASDAISGDDCSRREIVIEAHMKDVWGVEIVVSDSGPGISSESTDRMFDPFYTSKQDGLGIGLGICSSIVESHGGRIWVGEPVLGGASVHFDLPAHPQPSDLYAI